MERNVYSPTSNKRSREDVTQSDASDDDDDTPLVIQSKDHQESSLDLGNDQMDYKRSTIPKHHQR